MNVEGELWNKLNKSIHNHSEYIYNTNSWKGFLLVTSNSIYHDTYCFADIIFSYHKFAVCQSNGMLDTIKIWSNLATEHQTDIQICLQAM